MDDLWEAYYEHHFYDNPDDIEFKGYEENTSDNGVKYYVFAGDSLLSRCEKLIGEGQEEEVYKLLNEDVNFEWEKTLENDIIERQDKAVKKQDEENDAPPKYNFLDKMGVVSHG